MRQSLLNFTDTFQDDPKEQDTKEGLEFEYTREQVGGIGDPPRHFHPI